MISGILNYFARQKQASEAWHAEQRKVEQDVMKSIADDTDFLNDVYIAWYIGVMTDAEFERLHRLANQANYLRREKYDL